MCFEFIEYGKRVLPTIWAPKLAVRAVFAHAIVGAWDFSTFSVEPRWVFSFVPILLVRTEPAVECRFVGRILAIRESEGVFGSVTHLALGVGYGSSRYLAMGRVFGFVASVIDKRCEFLVHSYGKQFVRSDRFRASKKSEESDYGYSEFYHFVIFGINPLRFGRACWKRKRPNRRSRTPVRTLRKLRSTPCPSISTR